MAHYYFHVYDDVVALDDDGVELSDDEAALREAVRGARSLACEQVAAGRLRLHHRIVVADESGREVATLRFGDVIAVEDWPCGDSRSTATPWAVRP